jgi:hypothetical protein
MNDLELWERLTNIDADEDPEGLAASLRTLGDASACVRSPFLGFVDELLSHEHASLRAAALALLAGAQGHTGLSRVVAALDDDHEEVRAEAVRILRGCATTSPARWAHAVFHPRVDVRRLALATEPPRGMEALGCYLHADPEVRDLAHEHPWPLKPAGLVFDMLLRGYIDLERAGLELVQAQPLELRKLFTHSVRRTMEFVGPRLGRFETGEPLPDEGRDLFDLWCKIYWAHDRLRPLLLQRLSEAVLAKGRSLRTRATYALLLHGARHGHQPEILQLVAACHPGMLRSPLIDLDARRLAGIGLRLYRDRVPRIKEPLVRELLRNPLVLDGQDLDIGLAALLAGFIPGETTDTLRELVGEERLVREALSTPSAWSTLAELPDEKDGGPLWLLQAMHAQDPGSSEGFILAGAAHWIRADAEARSQSRKMLFRTLWNRVVAWMDPSLSAAVLAGLRTASLTSKHIGKLADVLSPKLGSDELLSVFDALMLDAGDPCCSLVLQRLLHHHDAAPLAAVIAALPEEHRATFCEYAEELQIAKSTEFAIANALKGDSHPDVAEWAETLLGARKTKATTPQARPEGTRELTPAEMNAIASADEEQLVAALAPALAQPSVGVALALARRPPPSEPHVHACVALVACPDSLERVSAQLDRFGAASSAFIESMAPLAVELWQGIPTLPPLGHALLHRWERHSFALLGWIDTRPGGLAEALQVSAAHDEPLVRRLLWEGIASAVMLRRYRQNARMRAWCTHKTMALLVEQLDTEVGPSAARMLTAFHITTFAATHLTSLRGQAVSMLPDMDADTRHALQGWIRVDGLKARATPARRRAPKLAQDRLEAIRRSTDIPALVRQCASPRESLVHEAALRLIELGPDGQQALALILSSAHTEASMLAVAASVSLWSDNASLEVVRGLARDPAQPAHLRFRIALALHQRESDWESVVLAAAAAPSETAWLTAHDWTTLTRVVPNLRTLSTTLAGSVHPNAYQRAVRWLLDDGGDDERTLAALRAFLHAGTERPGGVRLAVARRLFASGYDAAAVVLLRNALDPDCKDAGLQALYDAMPDAGSRERVLQHGLGAALLGGPEFCTEARCLMLVRANRRDLSARAAGLRRLLLEGSDKRVRPDVVKAVSRSDTRATKLEQVAQVFAWGVRKGRELSGRMFSVHMTDRRSDLGYTRMNENTIYVSPLPLLRGDRHGRDVVEALILHEFGHHLYHRGTQAQRIWQRAHKEGIGSVLNLVADEHLERRLRAVDASYGDRLKRLAAYAFQHSNRELAVPELLDMLQASAFEALSVRPLGVAFNDKSVVVDSGLVLRELDRRGHPFARFVRAMRMGLGNRHDDPLLERALSLFKGGFRHKDMRGLYEIAVELSLMYGTQSSLAKTYGGHESLEWDRREGAVHGDGLSDAEVQPEVERILKPPSASGPSGPPGRPGRLQINVGPDTAFSEITKVERIPIDRERHRQAARDVRRHAMRLRQYFDDLGLSLVPRRARLRGRAFDRTRVRAVVTRRDPRMLVARELEIQTDLFIGVVIDCSGSMSSGQSMEKAHRFGVLLAEASRGLPGVDARFFGFTDSEIFDAGDASNCAVTSLEPTGGNNDAAGLKHAASVAAGSRRKAKLLVMISDGLPTECSVEALRNLVQQLARRQGILCAQVAVRPLDEVCFPDYIELLEPELDRAVRRFGEVLTGLARRALGR